MSIVGTTKMTARQFLELGEDPPGVRLELANGEIVVSPSPIPDHSYAVTKLSSILDRFAEEHDLGQVYTDVDTIFGEYDVRRPDVLFFSKGRLHLIGEKAMEGPPDLAVEVISPGSTKRDRREKFELYGSGGVENYWMVDPAARTLEAWRLEGGAYSEAGRGKGDEVVNLPPFEGLDIPLGRLWRPR